MYKKELASAVLAVKEETRKALQTMYDAMNPGQQKQIARDEKVKVLFDRYGVEVRE